jgi:hypothetical protein
MPLNREYAERLRTATERYLRKPVPIGEGDADATVELFETKGRFHLRMRADGRQLELGVDDGVYHLEPDGSDAEKHANWLAQAFNEDAQLDHG